MRWQIWFWKPKQTYKSNIVPCTWKWTQMTCTRNARPQQRSRHHSLYSTKQRTTREDQGCDLWPNHMSSHPEKIDEPIEHFGSWRWESTLPWQCGHSCSWLTNCKLFINSIVSTPGAKFITMDIKDFYLNNSMPIQGNAPPHLWHTRWCDTALHILKDIATPDGFIDCEKCKGMYSLPQARIIAQLLLEERLQNMATSKSKLHPGCENMTLISSVSDVNDFGVKCTSKEHALQQLNTIQTYYKHSCNRNGERYCGLTFMWDYKGKQVHLLMPN